MFDIWMRLLQRVEGSALWLYQENEGARRNLRNEAQNRGIDPARVVFAARMALDKHLARYRLADLFLDTLPYNAHTTASDALWAGLPLLTCKGEAFAGRVAASILHAVGLPELVACSLAEYEALAHKLATDPALLASLRDKLKDNRNSAPLFDSERFRRNIEAAYLAMWTICQRGDAPHHFAVAPAAAELSMRQP
jgi:predicted O-linked N-acetylglucosamine transferase (SPINDLY family)